MHRSDANISFIVRTHAPAVIAHLFACDEERHDAEKLEAVGRHRRQREEAIHDVHSQEEGLLLHAMTVDHPRHPVDQHGAHAFRDLRNKDKTNRQIFSKQAYKSAS